VPSSQAALIVWHCGSNDVNSRRTPESILKTVRDWITQTQTALPEARLLLVSIIRAPQKRVDDLLGAVMPSTVAYSSAQRP
jgi:hypothetical protein